MLVFRSCIAWPEMAYMRRMGKKKTTIATIPVDLKSILIHSTFACSGAFMCVSFMFPLPFSQSEWLTVYTKKYEGKFSCSKDSNGKQGKLHRTIFPISSAPYNSQFHFVQMNQKSKNVYVKLLFTILLFALAPFELNFFSSFLYILWLSHRLCSVRIACHLWIFI